MRPGAFTMTRLNTGQCCASMRPVAWQTLDFTELFAGAGNLARTFVLDGQRAGAADIRHGRGMDVTASLGFGLESQSCGSDLLYACMS